MGRNLVDRGKIKRPSYAVASVDNALRLIQILRDTGELRVSTAANELGMAVSTVHRLLAMLAYHGFAIRDDSKAYLPGPALGAVPVMGTSLKIVRNACLPHLELLSGYLNETVTLHFRVGSKVRFLDAVESTAVLRIGSQRGVILDARSASGGKALLAETSLQTLERLYRSRAAEIAGEALDDADFAKLLRQLEQVHRDGYARNFQETAVGVLCYRPEPSSPLFRSRSQPSDRPLSSTRSCLPLSAKLSGTWRLQSRRRTFDPACDNLVLA
jgi:IclR family acetate operon transcriptional repressor